MNTNKIYLLRYGFSVVDDSCGNRINRIHDTKKNMSGLTNPNKITINKNPFSNRYSFCLEDKL